MPAVTPGSKVLVTGANGFIAVWVVRTLLEHGFAVRGTVRTEAKAAHLRNLFKSYGDKHEVVIVKDITKESAFDEAVKGVDAIEHTASPFHYNADDPSELTNPAVDGTLSVLRSALAHGTAVKRIVVTSSVAAVNRNPSPGEATPLVLSEADWNEPAVREVKEKGKHTDGANNYQASKTLAEGAAWVFVEKHKGEIEWDLVTVNPGYVFGPAIHEVKQGSPDALSTSMKELLNAVWGKKDAETLAKSGGTWIDVRDLAEAHVRAIEKEAAGGERILVTKGAFKWQDWVNTMRKFEPKLPAGNTSYKSADAKHAYVFKSEKLAKLLGMNHLIGEEQSARNMVADFKEKGVWPPK